MPTEIRTLYRCGECREIHDYEDEARDCCRPSIDECFECPVCKELHDAEEKAGSCCGFAVVRCPNCHRDHGTGSIDHPAVTIAGHCRECNPLYTIDQQLTIEDMHHQATGRKECLNA